MRSEFYQGTAIGPTELPTLNAAIPELTDRARGICGSLGEAVNGVGRTLDRAFGARPEKGEQSASPKPVANGSIEELREALDQIERLTYRLRDEYGPRLAELT